MALTAKPACLNKNLPFQRRDAPTPTIFVMMPERGQGATSNLRSVTRHYGADQVDSEAEGRYSSVLHIGTFAGRLLEEL